MGTLKSQLLPADVTADEVRNPSRFSGNPAVLIVSPDPKVSQSLLRRLSGQTIDVLVCASRDEADAILRRRDVQLVFCDEYLSDGNYFDLIQQSPEKTPAPRVVITTWNGGWELYFAALAKGAFDVIRCSARASDVQMVIARALQEDASLRRSSSATA